MYPRCINALAIALLVLVAGCETDELPEPGSPAYEEAVTRFYASLAALQASEDLGADEDLQRVTELAPGEPAAWANLGLIALRRNELDLARERLEHAQALAPDNAQIQILLAQLASTEGQFEAALDHLRRARELDPDNLKAAYLLVEQLERATPEGYEADVQQLLEELVAAAPDNVALHLERLRFAARTGNRNVVQHEVDWLAQRAPAWPPEVRAQRESVQQAVAAGNLDQVGTGVAFLRNTLLQVPAFRSDLAALRTPPEEVADLITRFLRLPSPQPQPAPPDPTVQFTAAPLGEPWTSVEVLWPQGDAPLIIGVADGQVHVGAQSLALPGVWPNRQAPAIAPLDANYDFRMDLALAGPEGVRLFFQEADGTYTDVTGAAGLSAAVREAAYTGAWAFDVDLEGDVDLVLGRPEAAPVLLRNNGDGTFTSQSLDGPAGLHDFAWGDLDRDGDPDYAMLGAGGSLQVYWNERMGVLRPADALPTSAEVRAVTIADVEADGRLDVLLHEAGRGVDRLTWNSAEASWARHDLLAAFAMPQGADEAIRLMTGDLDNNGALDLVVASPGETRVGLQGTDDGIADTRAVDAFVQAVADVDQDGRLDLVGVSSGGEAVQLVNEGTAGYNWQILQPQAAQALGDQRINSFGIGGLVEARAGLLYQQRRITAPVVHLGLGTHAQTDVVRIIWPNGNVQAEFDLAAAQTVEATQRLKGSCPWLFAFDGEGMQFVTDILWRSPLGLAINAQEAAGVVMTEDWVRVRSDQLVPRDGFYDLRITAELWETHFFDSFELMVVDHPEQVAVYVDERFVVPPPEWTLHALTPARPVKQAWREGADVTELVQARDARYAGPTALTAYQGIAQEHVVELDLSDTDPAETELRLVAVGWTRPTDSSINVALSQGAHPAPQGLSLEVPDDHGGWRTVRADQGFPAGKLKTVLLDLSDVFERGTPRRLRLRTNLEIYWDFIGWAYARPDAALNVQRLAPETADLRYRGYSAVSEADRTSPELPDYHTLEGTAPRWQDLVGFYTRYGDVRPLLAEVDDRYVIMNAGDEMRLRFPALPEPPEGTTRTFIFVSDGWNKDGDLNTTFSKTVRPLPFHDQPDYTTPPGNLTADPVYQRHAEDWTTYHTRYVTPERFRTALVR